MKQSSNRIVSQQAAAQQPKEISSAAALNSSFLRGFSQVSNQQPKSRQNSPSPQASISFEQQQLHRIVKLKKQSSMNIDGEQSSLLLSTTSPVLVQESDLPQPGPARFSHQKARNMRISQQRILRESSLDNSLQLIQQQMVDSQQSQSKKQNSANYTATSNNVRLTQQPRTHSQEPQDGTKLVKKVAMKGLQRVNAASNNVSSMAPVRQSSLTQRQGPILQSGPHTRSKSSAVGTEMAIQQMQSQQVKPSRKSNSRGRATPQGRLSQLNNHSQQQQQPQLKKVKKTAEQKSSLTITSPKDSSGDLNTSMPLPLSKSHNKVIKQLEKNQQSQRTGRQQQVGLTKPLASTTSQSNAQVSANFTKATMTPSGATYQHTRKQSTTRHRSNSKKRGSINTSIRRQIEKSPGVTRGSGTLAMQTQQTKQSTATKAHGYGASINWSKDQGSIVQNQLLVDQQMAALAASAFSQQQNPAHQQSLHSQQTILSAIPIAQRGKLTTSSMEDKQLFLAVSSTLGQTQGHRLTPLVGSKSNRRQSNDRKNKSLAVQHLEARSMEIMFQNQSDEGEPAQTLIGVDLQDEQQQIRTNTEELQQMKPNPAATKNLAMQHQQWSAHPNQHAVNSQFSSFTKDHQNSAALEAKHASAQKILRPKNSLIGGVSSHMERSESPSGHLRAGAKPLKSGRTSVPDSNANEAAINQVYMQPNSQFMQVLRQSRQQPTQTQPAFNSRMSQNTIHQQSGVQSAQSSRTTHDIYMKQPVLKSQLMGGPSSKIKSMSSRTMQSISSQQTPYEPNSQGGNAMQNTYGSTSAGKVREADISKKATFKDFRPKTQMSVVSQDSRSQMLDRDVSGLSPEPKAEIILSKNQIQRAARQKIQGQSQISIAKSDVRTHQSVQKLKFSQIQQANQSLSKEMAKKVIKSQRFMQGDTKHAKSFSNGQTAGAGNNNFLFFESKNLSVLNANYLNSVNQQPASNSVTNQETTAKELSQQSRPFAAKSASKVNPKHSNSMVQNWIYSADNSEENSSVQAPLQGTTTSLQQQKKTATTYRQIGGLGHTTRQKFGQKQSVFSSSEKQETNSVRDVPQFEQNVQQYTIQVPTSKSQRSKHNLSKTVFPAGASTDLASQQLYAPFNPAAPGEEGQTHSQRQLVQGSMHGFSQEMMVPQHLKSVQVQPNSNTSADVINQKVFLRGSGAHSSQTIESILQAEQSHQKILGPVQQHSVQQVQASSSSSGVQPRKLKQKKNGQQQPPSADKNKSNNHNAYANNAEDYFKKGTKTPADKASKQLRKGVVASKTSANSVVGGQAQSQHISGKASPHLQSDLGVEQQTSQQLETRSALTANGPPLSFVSQSSSLINPQTSQHNEATLNEVKSMGMSRSRLSQFVVQSNMMKSTQQQTASYNASAPSKTPNSSSTHASVKKSAHVKVINQHDIVKKASQTTAKVHVEDFHSGKVSSKIGGTRAALTQSELMRKKNQAKMVGASTLSAKQQQNLTMQHFIQQQDSAAVGGKTFGSGAVIQKEPDTTLMSAATNKIQRVSPQPLPGQIHHPNQKTVKSLKSSQGPRAAHQQDNLQSYASQAQSKQQAIGSKPNSQQRDQYQEYLQSQQISEKRSARPRHQQGETEARSVTTLGASQTADVLTSNQSNRKFNKNQPQRSVSDFGFTANQHQNGIVSSASISEINNVFQATTHEPAEFNEAMPQRLNLANLVEKVDKKLAKSEMLISSQLSTNTSQNSSSFYDDKSGGKGGRFGANSQQVMTPLVTFQAHQNSVIGLQATNMLKTGQFASFSKDNSVKVWSLSTQKATELISNNRAANMNLPPVVTLKRQIKNQARPSQKLSSFSFMSLQDGGSTFSDHQRSVLVTGCTDKTLRLYELEYPETAENYERRDYTLRKSDATGQADVMAPMIKVTGEHRGVISSIVQLPDSVAANGDAGAYSDRFLTGCSDGLIRMFSLADLYQGGEKAVCTFDQGSSGVVQICAMTENSFISSGHDNNVRLWDVRASDRQRLLEGANFGKVTWLQKYDSTIFASASNDGLVNFWDTRKMQLLTKVEIPSHGSICSLQFTKKRQYMLVAHDHKISVINITANGGNSQSSSNSSKSQQQSFTIYANQEAPIAASLKQSQPALATEDSWGNCAKLTSMTINEAEKKVYTGSFNKKITVWNLNLGAFN